MKNVIRLGSLVAIALGLGLTAQAAPPAAASAAAPAAPSAKGPFQRDLMGVVGYASKHVVELEEAVPQNKLTWRPGPGVRSMAEVYLHIAFANYGMIKAATGKLPPSDVGFDGNAAKWDKKTTDKAEIKKILEGSFAYVQEALAAFPDADLDKKVAFFGHDATARSVLIILDGHINEHLGQAVAYARMNKITPPWSKDEKMPVAEKKP